MRHFHLHFFSLISQGNWSSFEYSKQKRWLTRDHINITDACAAGLVLIVCRLCPRLWAGLDHTATSASWEQCQGILQGIAAFSVSARKSLDLLRKIDGAVTQLQAGESSGPLAQMDMPSL